MDSNINREHKNSVFSALFSTPEVLRELYSAIACVDIPSDAVIYINTLSDALYMRQINDVSFTINNKLVVLIEHQSTINENVPIRLLMYIGRVYEKIVDREKLYQKKVEKIPTPEFIVLFNGKAPCPDHLEEAMKSAVKYCIERKILKQFLEAHSASEVMNMLFGDISYERIEEIRAKEVYEEACESIREKIAQNALAEGASPEFVKKITGLDLEKIQCLNI